MSKYMYLIGYLGVFLSTSGLVFKLQRWPGAAVMLVLGVAILNLAFFPAYFSHLYKKDSEG